MNYLALIRWFCSTKIHSQTLSVVMGEATPIFLVATAGLIVELYSFFLLDGTNMTNTLT